MSTLVFPSEEALQLALTSRIVPPEVQAAPARVHRTDAGELHVAPEVAVAKAVLTRLGELGIRPAPKSSRGGTEVSCWAEVLATRPAPLDGALGGAVLFLPSEPEALLPLAGELLRLGCDRQEACFARKGARQGALLRAMSPPYFTLTRAMDHAGGLRAFVPAVPGRTSVWVELGHVHPLARTLQPAAGTLLLVPARGPWLTLPDGPWTDLYQLTDLVLPEPAEDWTPRAATARLSVPLRLTRAARTEAASLWVLREEAVAQVESLVHTLPEGLLAQLRFAVAGTPDAPVIVLRARAGGRERPPELGLSGMAYAPLPQLADLYLPCDGLLEPPVRRDRLRALLTPEADTVTWLHPTGNGGFRAERLPEKAFQPLDTWVDYVVEGGAAELTAWMKGATFDFEAIEAASGEWLVGGGLPAPAAGRDEAEPDTRRSRRAAPAQATPVRAAKAATPAPDPGPTLATLTPAQLSAAEEELTQVEKTFLSLEEPPDAPERQRLWVRMAELNGQLGRGRDAALCWTRVLWEATGEEAGALATRWAHAERRASDTPEALLGRDAPSEDEVRVVVSQLVRAVRTDPATAPGSVPALQRWLDHHDTALDVRSLWLSRTALDALAGGDALGLARAGDRLLGMLQRGLSPSRDVPRFLRGSGNAADLPRLTAQLGALRERFERTARRRSSVEAPQELTQAYVRFVFACGMARLGQSDGARALAEAATRALDAKEPIHGFFLRAYAARVDQALEGQPLEAPLPPAIAAELNALASFQRYKVDRLRQASALLEPSERLDPARAFGRGTRDLRGEEFAALRDLQDVREVTATVQALVKRATAPRLQAAEQQRLIGGLLETLPRLAPARALPLMDQLVHAVDALPGEVQARLLGDALSLTALFGRADRATSLAARLREVLAGLAPESPAWGQGILEASLRGLRRVGLTRQSGQLVDASRRLLTHAKAPLAARLGVASGLATLGHVEEALPVFRQAFDALAAAQGALPDRLALTRSLAGALAHTPMEVALPGLARLSEALPTVTDSFNTNSHFCLSVVEFADTLVMGHVELAQGAGERARSWLDEDEFLVRRRVHRELEERT
ncbi:hypothetical protein LZ198_25995 [Myxococcus sp. K15C18031901]|uniref:hypothetical protein n=1 Tax=Myxococcus dinghuensis TaxID=2906761 RepID=UPI0020A79645|nr:hypothetical protein [Myxococcus dinghuensis]MCP3102328.1 hypothetical protein [Myxococcus dinghuensis]